MPLKSSSIYKPAGGWVFYLMFLAILLITYAFSLPIKITVMLVVLLIVLRIIVASSSLFGGTAVADQIADEVGIERGLLKTALTDVAVNFKNLETEKNLMQSTGFTEVEAIELLALKNATNIFVGLDRLEEKFPNQQEIGTAQRNLNRYIEAKDKETGSGQDD